MKTLIAVLMLLLIGFPAMAVNAQDLSGEVAELRQLVDQMRVDYEKRISELEARLAQAEKTANVARRAADEFALRDSFALNGFCSLIIWQPSSNLRRLLCLQSLLEFCR